jgi:SAM-dependent methyltransferase
MDPPSGTELVPQELFDEEVYDYFYADLLEPGSEAQARLIAELGELHAGAEVLDVPCGDGRIAVRLASMGARVVGLDVSERFIAKARQRPGADKVRFEVGDMRALAHEAAFDCVVNWFTSFGYFDAATNRAVLRAFRRALRPGGRLVLELRNPVLLQRAVDAGGGTCAHVVDRGSELLVDRISIVGDRSRTERFVVRPPTAASASWNSRSRSSMPTRWRPLCKRPASPRCGSSTNARSPSVPTAPDSWRWRARADSESLSERDRLDRPRA